jgi:hypothetical protein
VTLRFGYGTFGYGTFGYGTFGYGTSGLTQHRLPDVLTSLADIGHCGPVSVEIQGGAFDAPDIARRSSDFLRPGAR